MVNLEARLDARHDRLVRCGRCGEILASIINTTPVKAKPWQAGEPMDRLLYIPPGYTKEHDEAEGADHWKITRHGRRQYKVWGKPLFRRGNTTDPSRALGEEPRSSKPTRTRQVHMRVDALPALIDCAHCTRPQWLTPKALSVTRV